MTLTIELTPEQEAKLQARAAANGTDPQSILGELVEALPETRPFGADQDLTPFQRAEELRAMFAEWASEDALMTPEQIGAAEAGWEAIERNLAERGVTLGRVDVSDCE